MVMNNVISYVIIFGIFTVMMTSSINMADAELSYSKQVEFVGAIEETMGHILAAKDNIVDGNSELASLHLSHPIAELYDNLHNGLKNNPQIDSQVELALFILKNTNPDISSENFDEEAIEILKILNEAKSVLIQNDVYTNPTFKLDVISDLLMMSEHEYILGINSGGGDISIVEFQDSHAFVVRAEIMLNTIDSLDEDKKNNLSSQLQELKSLILNEEPLDVVQTQFNNVLEEKNTITDNNFNSNIVVMSSGGILNDDLESNQMEKNTKNNVFSDDSAIPPWIKLNAAWCADGLVPDVEFIFGLEYLIGENVLSVSPTQVLSENSSTVIPDWIKHRTAWWADGLVPDAEFISGLEYLIQRGILRT